MEEDLNPRRDPLRYRSAELIAAILDAIYDDPEPIPWTDLVHNFTTEAHPPRTIEATLYDLVAYGAVHRIGKPATTRTHDTRALRQTALGRAWWTGSDYPERPTR